MLNRTVVLGVLWVTPLLLIASESAAAPGFAVNHVIDDASWSAQTGRAPRSDDDPVARTAIHLAYVERLLRSTPIDHLAPAQQVARLKLLDELRRYRRVGTFPQHTRNSPDGTTHRPRFIDDQGRHCAVGHLVAVSGAKALAQELNANFEYAYLEEIAAADDRIASWAKASGLTLTELALIQPSYEWRPQRIPTPTPLRPALRLLLVNTNPVVLPPSAAFDGNISGPRDRRDRRHGVWVQRRITSPSRQPRCGSTLPAKPICPGLASRVVFRHGKRHGAEVHFDVTGRPILHGLWSKGRRIGAWLHSVGDIVVTHSYDRLGRLHGSYEAWDMRRKTVVIKGRFAHGRKVGKWRIRPRQDQRFIAMGKYRKDRQVGTWTLFRTTKKAPRQVATASFTSKGRFVRFSQTAPHGGPASR